MAPLVRATARPEAGSRLLDRDLGAGRRRHGGALMGIAAGADAVPTGVGGATLRAGIVVVARGVGAGRLAGIAIAATVFWAA